MPRGRLVVFVRAGGRWQIVGTHPSFVARQ
jgi:hypothetical protein